MMHDISFGPDYVEEIPSVSTFVSGGIEELPPAISN